MNFIEASMFVQTGALNTCGCKPSSSHLDNGILYSLPNRNEDYAWSESSGFIPVSIGGYYSCIPIGFAFRTLQGKTIFSNKDDLITHGKEGDACYIGSSYRGVGYSEDHGDKTYIFQDDEHSFCTILIGILEGD